MLRSSFAYEAIETEYWIRSKNLRPEIESRVSIWRRIHNATFGIVYGAITVLSILMATDHEVENPLQIAVVLFGSVLAITLAKAFAGFLANALETGERLTRSDWREAWVHSAPTLAAANLPTVLFIASGIGVVSPQDALLTSQAVCVALLATIGARLGWVVGGRVSQSVAGAVFSGGIGLTLAVLKHLIH